HAAFRPIPWVFPPQTQRQHETGLSESRQRAENTRFRGLGGDFRAPVPGRSAPLRAGLPCRGGRRRRLRTSSAVTTVPGSKVSTAQIPVTSPESNVATVHSVSPVASHKIAHVSVQHAHAAESTPYRRDCTLSFRCALRIPLMPLLRGLRGRFLL